MPRKLDFSLLPSTAYYRSLQKALNRAKRRIYIHAMIVAWTPGMDQLLPVISAALDRGVQVHIIGDRYTKLYLRLWNRFERSAGRARTWEETAKQNTQLQQKGATITYIEKIKPFNPFAGRCHSKIIIVDDTIFSFGGINFGDQDLRSDMPNLDFMLTTTDAPLANYTATLLDMLADDKGAVPNRKHSLDEQTTLLYDGGAPKRSIIYDTACRVVARAQTIYYVSQHPPSGRLGYLIAQKQNRCYFNRIGKGDFPLNLPFLVDKLRYRLVNHYQKSPYIHAKFILTEEADGSRHLITGSNNFSWSGVQLGTKEIAIHSTDAVLWEKLYRFLEDTVA